MAGGGDSEDNPVNINVVPMVDVIFCLCVFFMCSFKFKELEGKFASWLPKNKGNQTAVAETIEEIRVAMFWDEDKQEVRRQYKSRMVDEDAELLEILRGAYEDSVRINKPEMPVIIDAEYKVPWSEVMAVVNMVKTLEIPNMEFAMGAAGAPKK